MKDLIDRAMAIDALDKRFDSIPMEQTTEILQLRKDLRELPSAQPETAERTTETAQNVSDGDLISRKAVIDVLRTCYDMDRKDFTNGDEYINYDQAVFLTEQLPSAQPETAKRIVGKSRDGMTLWYQCDMCNEPVDAQDDFCRGCGRRLTDG